jgi:hypothetical protein
LKGSSRVVLSKRSSTNERKAQIRAQRVEAFSSYVVRAIAALKAVYLDSKELTSLGAPSVPFEAIELEEALKEDAPAWLEAIDQELKSLKMNNTFAIIRGKIPNGHKVISCRWVLKKKLKRSGLINRRKA